MEVLLISLINLKSINSLLLQFFSMVVVSIIPFAPVPVLATAIGANNTLIVGLLINLIGTLVGSIILYLLSRNLFRQRSEKVLRKYRNFERFMLLIYTNGFLAILIGRLVPIIPSAAVNLIAGVSGVSFFSFIAATILGKFPIILACSIAGNHLAARDWNTVILVSLYLLLIIVIGQKIKKKWISKRSNVEKNII